MIEDSVDNFILNYKTYAAEIEILPKLEGSPLVEAIVVDKVIHFFERTGPYESKAGLARVILNPNLEELFDNSEHKKSLLVTGISRIEAKGLVLERENRAIVVDVGFPLVVTCLDEIPDEIIAGEWIGFGSSSPIHGFVLAKPKTREEY